jgi:mRNA interferase RelE/StbE
MNYQIIYEETVIREDFPRLGESVRQRIIKEVGKKLSVAPNQFGRPLGDVLKGYRRLRVGDYRVIYRVDDDNTSVLVVMVIHRRTKYKGVKERISKYD